MSPLSCCGLRLPSWWPWRSSSDDESSSDDPSLLPTSTSGRGAGRRTASLAGARGGRGRNSAQRWSSSDSAAAPLLHDIESIEEYSDATSVGGLDGTGTGAGLHSGGPNAELGNHLANSGLNADGTLSATAASNAALEEALREVVARAGDSFIDITAATSRIPTEGGGYRNGYGGGYGGGGRNSSRHSSSNSGSGFGHNNAGSRGARTSYGNYGYNPHSHAPHPGQSSSSSSSSSSNIKNNNSNNNNNNNGNISGNSNSRASGNGSRRGSTSASNVDCAQSVPADGPMRPHLRLEQPGETVITVLSPTTPEYKLMADAMNKIQDALRDFRINYSGQIVVSFM